MKSLLIVLISLSPVLLSLLLLPKAKQRWQNNLRRARNQASRRTRLVNHTPANRGKSSIGDTSCFYNARSPYLRCAINPDGPCEGCPHYQPKR